MKNARVLSKDTSREKEHKGNQHNYLVFCEKLTGLVQFRAATSGDSDLGIERIASSLVVHCLVHGQDPEDFIILAPVRKDMANRLVSRAKDLLEEGRAIPASACLSPRQKEIVSSLISNKANKEIASHLNISVRTVKFHISSLLRKFGVQSRTELARRASGLLRPANFEESPSGLQNFKDESGNAPRPLVVETPVPASRSARSVPFPGRVLSA